MTMVERYEDTLEIKRLAGMMEAFDYVAQRMAEGYEGVALIADICHKAQQVIDETKQLVERNT